jgi:hypothetical protein
MPLTTREYLDGMSTRQRDRVCKQLTLEAALRIGARSWRNHRRGGVPPGGVEARDVAHSVLTRALSSPVLHDDVYAYLRAEIIKRVDALRKRAENRDHRLEDLTAEGMEFADPRTQSFGGQLYPAEQQIFRSEAIKIFEKDFGSRASKLFESSLEDTPPRDIAIDLGLKVSDVYAERKKLKKKTPSVIFKLYGDLKR